MASLCMPRASRKLQRTFKNLRVSLLCFILTFLMLRNTIGAGKFGTPAQDFEEIRQHLHYVGLHRRHFRVLAEAVEEDDKRRDGSLAAVEKSPLPEEGNAASVGQRRSPWPLRGALSEEHAGHQMDLEAFRSRSWEEERKALAHGSYGDSRVLLVAGVHSPACTNPAGEHFFLKSLQNKVYYSTLHGLEISLRFGSVDPQMAKPALKLSLLRRTMIMYPHIEWLWWMPNDALFTDMSAALPMHNYTEFNLVLLGSTDESHPQNLIDLNTDTFLIRNSQWSLDLLSLSMNKRASEGGQVDRLLTNALIRGPHSGAADQSELISVVNPEKEGFVNKVHVKHAAVLRGKWHNVAEKFERIAKQSQRGGGGRLPLPFVTHFLGCNACQKGQGEVCANQMERVLIVAEKQGVRSDGFERKSSDSSLHGISKHGKDGVECL